LLPLAEMISIYMLTTRYIITAFEPSAFVVMAIDVGSAWW